MSTSTTTAMSARSSMPSMRTEDSTRGFPHGPTSLRNDSTSGPVRPVRRCRIRSELHFRLSWRRRSRCWRRKTCSAVHRLTWQFEHSMRSHRSLRFGIPSRLDDHDSGSVRRMASGPAGPAGREFFARRGSRRELLRLSARHCWLSRSAAVLRHRRSASPPVIRPLQLPRPSSQMGPIPPPTLRPPRLPHRLTLPKHPRRQEML